MYWAFTANQPVRLGLSPGASQSGWPGVAGYQNSVGSGSTSDEASKLLRALPRQPHRLATNPDEQVDTASLVFVAVSNAAGNAAAQTAKAVDDSSTARPLRSSRPLASSPALQPGRDLVRRLDESPPMRLRRPLNSATQLAA